MFIKNRSTQEITQADLYALLEIAQKNRKPSEDRVSDTPVLIALCQGAASHYVDKKTGVKDFDVWFFYAQEEYGKNDYDRGYSTVKLTGSQNFDGKEVQLFWRAHAAFNCGDAERGIHDYVEKGNTNSARELGKKAVVGLYPKEVFGEVLRDVYEGE